MNEFDKFLTPDEETVSEEVNSSQDETLGVETSEADEVLLPAQEESDTVEAAAEETSEAEPVAEEPVTEEPVEFRPGPLTILTDNPYATSETETAEASKPVTEKPKKKKFKWGCLIFGLIFLMLFAMFSAGFVGLCGYLLITDNSSILGQIFDKNNDFIEDFPTVPTEPTEDIIEGGVIPNHNTDNYSDDTYMVLHNPSDDIAGQKYTAQHAFNVISDSTVGVVCYQGAVTEDSKPASQGTGIVLSKDGYVVTNSHVIGDSREKYKVRVMTTDGTTYEALVIGYDSRTDLAVLKVDSNNLVPATFCDSDKVFVGQDVIAVGNPGGMDFQNSLTKGIISAKDRELSLSSQVSYLQTDAAINPGNSGGPLCNMQGQVIGINTAKISSSSYEGMGFAIPTQTAKQVVDDLIKQGYVSGRVRIGITGQPVTSTMAQYYGLPSGILISEIASDGPCSGTEIKVQDVLTAIDGENVKNFSEIYKILATHEAGDKVELTLYDTETQDYYTVKVTLAPDEGDTQQ